VGEVAACHPAARNPWAARGPFQRGVPCESKAESTATGTRRAAGAGADRHTTSKPEVRRNDKVKQWEEDAVNDATLTDPTRDTPQFAVGAHTEAYERREAVPQRRALRGLVRRLTNRLSRCDLRELRWMTRTLVVLVVLCLLLAAWVWYQILRVGL
jgi:hypothetical protein